MPNAPKIAIGVESIKLRVHAAPVSNVGETQTVLKRLDQLLLRIRIRKQILDALEAGARRGSKTIQEVDLIEEHRQVGREFWHGDIPLTFSYADHK